MREVVRVAWFRFRATFGRCWGGYLAIALLIALVGGVAMGALAGARRTQSAFPQYLAHSNASDLQVTISNPSQYGLNGYSPALTQTLAHLGHVRRVASNVNIFATPVRPNGAAVLPPALMSNEVATIGPVNGLYTDEDRVAVARGRMWDPHRADEFVMTAPAARLLGWHIGEVIPFGIFTVPQASSPGFGTPKVQPTVRVTAKLVGIVVFNDQIVRDEADQYPTYVLFTPALTQKVLASASYYPTYGLVLDRGSRDVGTVEQEIIGAIPRGDTYTFHLTSVVEAQTERATKPESIALGIFGLIATVAALLIAAQAVSRQLQSMRKDTDVLRALGANRAMTAADGLPGVLGAIMVGSLAAAGVGIALSSVTLIGPVRHLERSPGMSFDWTVLGVGLVVLIGSLSAMAVTIAVTSRRTVHGATPRRHASATVSTVAGAAAATGMPAPVVTGLRFALERGPGETAAPVRSALLGAVLAVVVVVSTLTFASGLRTLVSHPALYGWNWNYAIADQGGGNFPAVEEGLLSRDPDVSAWTGFDFAGVEIDGQTTPVLLAQTHAALSPPILTGHPIDGSKQVVLGAATLGQLHKHVGDSVVVSYGSPSSGPTYVPPTRLTIVGTATLPAIGNTDTLHVSMGTGAVLPIDIETAAIKRALTSPDPLGNGPNYVVVRLRPNVSRTAGLASLQRVAAAITKRVDADPNAGGTFAVLPVQQPAEIVNYRSMGTTPLLLAGALAIGAVVALGLALTASVRRRRRDLALLKTLGFTHRQLVATVASQATIAGLIGIMIGIPVGIALGRRLWTLFAHEIYAVPQPTVPTAAIIYIAISTLALANLVAAIPARQAARTPSAILLHEE